MEERQRQIREGAGLEESRLNTEFIEFLKRFSTPLLVVIAVVAGGYFLYNRYQVRHERQIDEAYAALDAAIESKNPVSLVRIADEQNIGAVRAQALLTAADLHLDSARTGIPTGTTPEKDGSLPKDAQPLTPEQKTEELTAAEKLYKQVVDENSGDSRRIVHLLSGLHGLAAVAESRGELDAAKGFYQQVIDRAQAAGLAECAKRAQSLKDTVDDLKTAPRLYNQSELPAAAVAAQPFSTGMQGMTFTTSDGKKMKMGDNGQLVPAEDGDTPPAPVPAPAPGAPAPGAQPAPTPAAPAPATPAPASNPPATAPATPALTPPPASPAPAGEPPKQPGR